MNLNQQLYENTLAAVREQLWCQEIRERRQNKIAVIEYPAINNNGF
jgi:hypothetical protein